MAAAELRGLAKPGREPLQAAVGGERRDGLELQPGGGARADEVRVIGVRKAVRALAGSRDDGALLEREHGLRGAREREHGLDRVPALRVRGGVGRTLDDREADLVLLGDAREEPCGVRGGRAQLEVRGALHREGAAAEERAAEVGRAAAGAGDDTARRALEGRMPAIEDACGDERSKGIGGAVDVELVAGRAVEGAPPVGPDLRADLLVAEQPEGAAGGGSAPQVEVERPAAPAVEVEAAGGVEERRELGEPVARAFRGDAGELLAHVLGGHRRTPSSSRRRRLTPRPADP